MNEVVVGRRIAMRLSASARELDPVVVEHLRAARARALERQRPQGWLAVLATGVGALGAGFALTPATRSAVMAGLILAVFFAGNQWVSDSRQSEILQVDAALLMDDLPIDAYLDPDFKTWLLQGSRS